MGTAHLLDCLGELVARGADVNRGLARQREQQVLCRDELVAHPARLLVGVLKELDQCLAEGRCARVSADRGLRVQSLVGAAAHPLGVGARPPQHGHDDPALLLEQREQQVLRCDLGISACACEALRGCERLLRLDCESVSLHKKI